MAYESTLDWRAARAVRIRQIRLSRNLHDELGVAIAQIGLSVIERRIGNLDEALRVAQEAEEAFKNIHSSVGLAAAYQNFANIYNYKEEHWAAIYNSRRALVLFEEARDPRGVGASLGVLGSSAKNIGDDNEAVFGLLGSIAIKRITGYAITPDGKRDELIQADALSEILRKIGKSEFERVLKNARQELVAIQHALELDALDTSISLDGAHW